MTARPAVKSLRARLFAATLAALALTLALTIAIGGGAHAPPGRPVAGGERRAPRRRARAPAAGERQLQDARTSSRAATRILIQPRASFVKLVPNVNRSSDGEATYLGKRQLYSYRTLPNRGLILLRPASLTRRLAAVPRRPAARRRSSGCLFAAVDVVLRRPLDRPARSGGSPTRRGPWRPTSATIRCRPKDRASSPRSRSRSTR